ncbi:hypothetical protein DFH08DRAFT_806020 [Mycena albidolilacea]|uniref:Uncharacterized protein n=1 Tax=Mycena albidolilacea TaxID=1033008 RepID=A0AAD7A7H2_9AGAR|nr:hypothetical protein DFH08DRAFT_806020 [Mycena albidolilacea]
MKNPTSELLSSLLLGLVALIPNHTFRYTTLMLFTTHQHNRVAKKASSIRCCILNSESESFSWNRFRMLSSDIRERTKDAKNICTAVELILEAERQRKLAGPLTIPLEARARNFGNP